VQTQQGKNYTEVFFGAFFGPPPPTPRPTCPHFTWNYVLVAKSKVMYDAIRNYIRMWNSYTWYYCPTNRILRLFRKMEILPPSCITFQYFWNVYTLFRLNWNTVQKNTIQSEIGQRRAASPAFLTRNGVRQNEVRYESLCSNRCRPLYGTHRYSISGRWGS
jgi:hypothetical protein